MKTVELDPRNLKSNWPEFAMIIGDLSKTSIYSPIVTSFIAEYLRSRSPRTVLDPWAGLGGMLIPVTEELDSIEQIQAIVREDLLQCKAKETNARIVWVCDDAFDWLSSTGHHFDAILASLPLVVRHDLTTITHRRKKVTVRNSLGDQLLIRSCLRLNETGVGVFSAAPASIIGPDGNDPNYAINKLEDFELRLDAYIAMSRELEPTLPLSTALIFISHGEERPIFAGELSANADHNTALLANLNARSCGTTSKLGHFASRIELQQEIGHQVRQQLQRLHQTIDGEPQMALAKFTPISRVKELRDGGHDSGSFSEDGNTVPRHSPDFRSVKWYGRHYTFTANQAACVAVLWKWWENETPVVSMPTVMEEAGLDPDCRLRDVFKTSKGMHPAWNQLIFKSGKDAVQLQQPKEDSA